MNSFSILKRFGMSSILNVLALSVAFAVCIIISLQLWYDFTFDRNFNDSDEIHLLSERDPTESRRKFYFSMQSIIKIKESFPEIKDYCVLSPAYSVALWISGENNTQQQFNECVGRSSQGFLDVFAPKIIAGDVSRLFLDMDKAMISQKTAEKLFGKENPVGKTVYWEQEGKPVTIVAVYKDFPANCSLKNGLYTYLPEDLPVNFNYWGCYKIDRKDCHRVLAKMNAREFLQTANVSQGHPEDGIEMELQPLLDLHLHHPEVGRGSIRFIASLSAIGIVLLAIAYINFINFTIALAPSRVRSVNLHKILGAKMGSLRAAIALEGVVLSAIALCLACVYVYIFQGTSLNHFITADLGLLHNAGKIGVVSGCLLAVSFLLGMYPAYYITSFESAIALKGSFTLSAKGVKLRNTLVTIQFTAAIVLMVVSSFIKLQHDYMQNHAWGIQQENILYVNAQALHTSFTAFGEELKKNPDVLDYTGAGFIPGGIHMGWTRIFHNKEVYFNAWPVRANFLHFFGVSMVSGNDFDPNGFNGTERIILNQEFLRKYDFDTDIVGSSIARCFDGEGQVVGIAEDVNFQSLRQPIVPMAFALLDERWIKWMFIKVSGNNMKSTIAYIEKTWKNNSDKNVDLRFLDEYINNLYQTEERLGQLIGLFSAIAILIAIMGVYGLVVFNTRYKTKEIGLRKINGASEREVVWMLNKETLQLLLLAFAMAVPVAYYIVYQWLADFSYKTSISWWVFAGAGLFVLLVTVAAVSGQSWKAATTNPVNAIKNE